jgi:uncharacterized repeat protein (TIGR01451 family)
MSKQRGQIHLVVWCASLVVLLGIATVIARTSAQAAIEVRRGTVTFVNRVSGGNAPPTAWNFAVGNHRQIPHRGSVRLATGLYRVTTESDATNQAAYTVSAAGACAFQSGQIQLTVAESTATCLLTHTVRPGQITLAVETIPPDAPQPFTFVRSFGPALTLHHGQRAVSEALHPGYYWVDDLARPVGWTAEQTRCSDGSSPHRIALAPGAAITCTFVNHNLPALMTLEKTPTLRQVLPDTTVSYAYTLTSYTSLRLSRVSVVDSQCAPLTFLDGDLDQDTFLDRGEQWRYSCTETVALDTTNVATATAITPGLTLVQAADVTFVDVLPVLKFSKSVTPLLAYTPDATVTYQLDFYNDGPEPLIIANIIDQEPASDPCLDLVNSVIAPSATVSCTYSVPYSTPGIYTNTATVSVRDDENNFLVISDIATVTVQIPPPLLTVTKVATPSVISEAGAPVTFTVKVKNTGLGETLRLNRVLDDRFGNINEHCDARLPFNLAQQATVTCALTVTLIGNPGDIYRNTATAIGVNTTGETIRASAQATVTFTDEPSSLTVSKSSNVDEVPPTGANVTFAVLIQNTSLADAITLDSLIDSSYGDVTDLNNPKLVITFCAAGMILAPSQQYSCTFEAFVAGAVGEEHTNVLLVNGTDDDGNPVAAKDEATVRIVAPIISATKRDALLTDSNQDGLAGAGDLIGYTVVVCNRGNQADRFTFVDTVDSLTTIVAGSPTTTQGVIEAAASRLSVAIGELPPQECATITWRMLVVTPLPVEVANILNQGAISTASGVSGVTDDPDTAALNDPTITPLGSQPVLTLTKRDSLAEDRDGSGGPSAGDVLQYTLVIANPGGQLARGVLLLDTPGDFLALVAGSVQSSRGQVQQGNQPGDTALRVDVGDLPGGEEARITFRASLAATLPPTLTLVSNQALVSGLNLSPKLSDDPDTPIADDLTETQLPAEPRLVAYKLDGPLVDVDQSGAPSPGDTLAYTITISNQGNQPATGVQLTDRLDPLTQLIVGSVQTSEGTVRTGNTPGDTTVEVALATLAPGATATITLQSALTSTLPPTATQISNQGQVVATNAQATLTDDPTTTTVGDATITPLDGAPTLELTKRDLLFTDADEDGQVSTGDTLLYLVKIVNTGSGSIHDLVVDDLPDLATTLVNGRVQVSQGTVQQGNGSGERRVVVQIGTLVPGATVNIAFRVTVGQPSTPSVSNQATIRFRNGETRTTLTMLSDDPDTATRNDPTLTPVTSTGASLYLPVVRR